MGNDKTTRSTTRSVRAQARALQAQKGIPYAEALRQVKAPSATPETFGTWLLTQTGLDDPVGDLARDYATSLEQGYPEMDEPVALEQDIRDRGAAGPLVMLALASAEADWNAHTGIVPSRGPWQNAGDDLPVFGAWFLRQSYREDFVGEAADFFQDVANEARDADQWSAEKVIDTLVEQHARPSVIDGARRAAQDWCVMTDDTAAEAACRAMRLLVSEGDQVWIATDSTLDSWRAAGLPTDNLWDLRSTRQGGIDDIEAMYDRFATMMASDARTYDGSTVLLVVDLADPLHATGWTGIEHKVVDLFRKGRAARIAPILIDGVDSPTLDMDEAGVHAVSTNSVMWASAKDGKSVRLPLWLFDATMENVADGRDERRFKD